MDEKKIRVTLPGNISNVIKTDSEDFEITPNRLCNIIFEEYNDKTGDIETYKSPYSKTLQFNLNKDNTGIYEILYIEKKIENHAEYFRKMFFRYSDQPKYKRELMIFKERVERINEAIKNKRQIRVKYDNDIRTIEPYFIINSDGETRNYVFCYCEKKGKYTAYRLVNIEPMKYRGDAFKKYDEKYIKDIKSNFDPYVSYGKTVKARFTDEGRKILSKVVTNRPKIIKEEGNTIIFECSEEKARAYFPKLLKEVEILEPKELREQFRETFRKMYEMYK